MNCNRCGLEICIEHYHNGQSLCENCYSLITTEQPKIYQNKTCPLCNKKDWDTGTIEIGNFPQSVVWDRGTYYHSNKKKFLKDRAALFAIVCLNCGHVELIVDVEFIKKNIKK